MYTSLFHSKPVPICTYLSLTGSWYKYAQISISQEARTNMYKSLPHRKLVQVCSEKISHLPEAGTNMYKSLSHRKPVQNCTKLFSHRKLVQICTNLYLTGSRYLYVKIFLPLAAGTNMYIQISPSQEAGTYMYKSPSHRELVQICTNLYFTRSCYKYV